MTHFFQMNKTEFQKLLDFLKFNIAEFHMYMP